jgi:hypothetical protein
MRGWPVKFFIANAPALGMARVTYGVRSLVSAFILVTYGVVAYSLYLLGKQYGLSYLVLATCAVILPLAATLSFLMVRGSWSWLIILLETILITELFVVLGINLLLNIAQIKDHIAWTSFGDYLYLLGPPIFVVLGAGTVAVLLADTSLQH